MNNRIIGIIAAIVVTIGVILFVVPMVNWGTLSLREGKTVTVVGTAESTVSNQVATFNAGFNVVNANKEEAIASVNKAMTEIIEQIKTFGIPAEDIKTENNSVYQEEEPITIEGRQTSQPGRWRVSNNITIKLRDIKRAQELTDLLSKSGANNVWGPTFAVDDTSNTDNTLLAEALTKAREKAEVLAAASGKKVGSVLSINEMGSVSAVTFARSEMGGGGGAPVEPGSQTVSKSITVTFELQ